MAGMDEVYSFSNASLSVISFNPVQGIEAQDPHRIGTASSIHLRLATTPRNNDAVGTSYFLVPPQKECYIVDISARHIVFQQRNFNLSFATAPFPHIDISHLWNFTLGIF